VRRRRAGTRGWIGACGPAIALLAVLAATATGNVIRTGTARSAARPRLRTLLVTGDSLSVPLDDDLSRRLAPAVRVIRDPHIGTGISSDFLLDWRAEARAQVRRDHPDAVVMFIGANDGFPLTGPGGVQVACCDRSWEALYAQRVRAIAEAYLRGRAARVYWLTLPAQRDPARERVAVVVNAAISSALAPLRGRAWIIDTVPIFSPGGRWRSSISIGGRPTVVRAPDGIHLNAAGSSLLAGLVQHSLAKGFTW
jgi:hypothetical protein